MAVASGATLSADTLSNNNGQIRFTDGASVTAGTVYNNGPVFSVSGNNTALRVTNQLTNLRTLQILNDATASAGSVSNSGNLLLNGTTLAVARQLASTGIVLVQNGATLAADSLLISGNSTTAPSMLSVGNINGYVADSAGRVNARQITLASSPTSRALVNFNHTDANYNFASPVTGTGDVVVTSGVTTLSGLNSYSGSTTVTGGLCARVQTIPLAQPPHGILAATVSWI